MVELAYSIVLSVSGHRDRFVPSNSRAASRSQSIGLTRFGGPLLLAEGGTEYLNVADDHRQGHVTFETLEPVIGAAIEAVHLQGVDSRFHRRMGSVSLLEGFRAAMEFYWLIQRVVYLYPNLADENTRKFINIFSRARSG